RYCDDLTFSGIGHIATANISFIETIICDEGFSLNRRKTHISRRKNRQMVTGLVVNSKISLPREQRKRLRAMCHQVTIDPESFADRVAELDGWLAYLKMIDPNSSLLGPNGKGTVAMRILLNEYC
ncbi:MAG: hypothetical protein IIB38_13535, partial [Candidatus Hydrogenedentes bacterium]|nr:hypothetical protein [Candidatus Hydrogenedentota bacterium]